MRPFETRAILRVRAGGENIAGDSQEEVPMLRRMPRPSPGPIHGCLGARGALRVIEPPATCEATEAALDFGQKGPAGERGPAGPPGSRLTAEESAVIDAGAELSTKATIEPCWLRSESTKAPKPGKLKLSRKQLADLAPEKKSEAFSAYRDGPVTLGPYKGAKSGWSRRCLCRPGGG